MRIKLWSALIVIVLLGFSSFSTAQASAPTFTASDLRTQLASQLTEYRFLAVNATSAALSGRTAEFQAATTALDVNAVELSKTIGMVYGTDSELAFLRIWRKHLSFVMDYATGVAAKDKVKAEKGLQDLIEFTDELGDFINISNRSLSKAAVADLIKPYIATLKEVIDAQAASDYAKAYTSLRASFRQLDTVVSTLSGAIVRQYPERFGGKVDSPATSLRVALTFLTEEHVHLVAMTTKSSLAGREGELKAAYSAMDGNSQDVAKAIGTVYGPEAEQAFLTMWRGHCDRLLEYSKALAAKDTAKAEQIWNEMVAGRARMAGFLSKANPNLPESAVSDLLLMHNTSMKDIVDAQAAGDQVKAYSALRKAFAHMSMVADPLSAAIVRQFPSHFGELSTLPQTGEEASDNSGSLIALLAMSLVLLAAGFYFTWRKEPMVRF